ncbi:MAG: hypothetical protein NUV82_01310 [Candidatus Komeilibacteria bacterium]|nr:hypothetical protein [Candidatus Komeilibacteria bacterium]
MEVFPLKDFHTTNLGDSNGSHIGVSVVIDVRGGDDPNNKIFGYYEAGESVARCAMDQEGFCYFNTQGRVFAYGKNKENELCVGIGADARTAKKSFIFSRDYYTEKRKLFWLDKHVWEPKAIVEGDITIHIFGVDQGERVNTLFRDFTWQIQPDDFVFQKVGEYGILATEGDFFLAGTESTMFQKVDNEHVIPISSHVVDLGETGKLWIAKAKLCARNNRTEIYCTLASLKTAIGEQFVGYETRESPYWDLDEILNSMRDKISYDLTSQVNSLNFRGSHVTNEEIINSFPEGFVGTPADSKEVGNCATGTWTWIKRKFSLRGPEQASWDDFPIPLDKEFKIEGERFQGLFLENEGFQRVVKRKFFENNSLKKGMTKEEVKSYLFDSLIPDEEDIA